MKVLDAYVQTIDLYIFSKISIHGRLLLWISEYSIYSAKKAS